MDGSEKRVPLVIGFSKKPRSFTNARRMLVKYVSNTKAWMTRALFTNWLQDFDADMGERKRKICLFIDNCSGHHLHDLQLSNIELQYFPPNCTSVVQPLDQGIIPSVKCAYRHRVLSKLLVDFRLERITKVDVFQAIEMLAASWASSTVIVIRNCFRKAGFCDKENMSCDRDRDGAEGNNVVQQLCDAWQSLTAYEDAVPEGATLDDFLQSDANVVATEEIDDSEIIRSVQDENDGSSDEDTAHSDACVVPSGKQVLDAIDAIRRYAGAQENMEQAVEAIWRYERIVMPLIQQTVQTKVTDYFARK